MPIVAGGRADCSLQRMATDPRRLPLLLTGFACALLGACGDGRAPAPRADGQAGARSDGKDVQADPRRGQALMAQYQCTACHAIPDVAGPAGGMGPTLKAFGRRSYIAGHIPNAPAALAAWLRSPQALVPGTAMPDLGVSETDARDMAAFLGTLR